MSATTIGVSLYPSHLEMVDSFADELKERGDINPDKKQVRSLAIQRIIAEWHQSRSRTSPIVDLSEGALEPYPAPATPSPSPITYPDAEERFAHGSGSLCRRVGCLNPATHGAFCQEHRLIRNTGT